MDQPFFRHQWREVEPQVAWILDFVPVATSAASSRQDFFIVGSRQVGLKSKQNGLTGKHGQNVGKKLAKQVEINQNFGEFYWGARFWFASHDLKKQPRDFSFPMFLIFPKLETFGTWVLYISRHKVWQKWTIKLRFAYTALRKKNRLQVLCTLKKPPGNSGSPCSKDHFLCLWFVATRFCGLRQFQRTDDMHVLQYQ